MAKLISLKQAVILAGGRGLRLRPITETIPKPMVLMNGRPFLEYLVALLKDSGIKDIVMLLGYLPEKITSHFGDGSRFGVSIRYAVTPVEDETGTRLRKARGLLEEYFLLMYCDNYWPIDLQNLIKFHSGRRVLATVTAYTNQDKITANNMTVDGDGYVVVYDRTRSAPHLNAVDIGFFIMNKKVLALMPPANHSLESEILTRLARERNLGAYRTDHRYYSIGSLERLKLTEQFLKPKKVIFLDRDGVINERPPAGQYVKNWDDFRFLPGAIPALKLLGENQYQLYLITNQAGVGRGIMSKSEVEFIHQKMTNQLGEQGIFFSGVYCCFHHWDERCECRKPKPGMFLEAAREQALDLTKTIFIGDDERDEMAGRAARCRTFLVGRDGQSLLHIVQKIISGKR